jgi:IclR family KDG regulon transcriptional repressor
MQNSNSYFVLRNLALDKDQKSTSIRAVYRAVVILVCLSNNTNTLTEIANCCRLTKPTVFRLMKTMEELHLVTQDPVTRHYYLGPLINQIASNPQANHHYLITSALEELRYLWDLSGETVELNIMVGLQYIRLHEIQSKFDLKVVQGPDPVGPIYVGATAKILLSQLNDEDLQIALRNIEISPVTEHSVTNKRELKKQIKQIRKQGYSISYGERISGALCISAPVSNYFWPVALSLIGPESRLQPQLEEITAKVRTSAYHISDNIKEYFKIKGVIDRINEKNYQPTKDD